MVRRKVWMVTFVRASSMPSDCLARVEEGSFVRIRVVVGVMERWVAISVGVSLGVAMMLSGDVVGVGWGDGECGC